MGILWACTGAVGCIELKMLDGTGRHREIKFTANNYYGQYTFTCAVFLAQLYLHPPCGGQTYKSKQCAYFRCQYLHQQ